MRWSPPELLDAERFEFKGGGPTKMGDVYSMAMTIHEVSFLQCKFGQSIEIGLGSDGHAPISRAQRSSGDDLHP